jgi:hypothetical protein
VVDGVFFSGVDFGFTGDTCARVGFFGGAADCLACTGVACLEMIGATSFSGVVDVADFAGSFETEPLAGAMDSSGGSMDSFCCSGTFSEVFFFTCDCFGSGVRSMPGSPDVDVDLACGCSTSSVTSVVVVVVHSST